MCMDYEFGMLINNVEIVCIESSNMQWFAITGTDW